MRLKQESMKESDGDIMAKNFGKATGISKTVKNVAKSSNTKANVIQIRMIPDDCLLDYAKNGEDISYTADIEVSIQQNGFTDPIEVTDFDTKAGMFTIISGHRRRAAGRKQGIATFPCIIRHYDTAEQVHNAVLLSNAQRDSSKDPLLFCRRYKMHEEYLKEIDFKGSYREEVARRLGISAQQADRYRDFNKIILPVWDMVQQGIVGMSSVITMNTHPVEEQEEIFLILNEAIENGEKLIRPLCEKIIKGYRDGKRTFADIMEDKMKIVSVENAKENETHIFEKMEEVTDKEEKLEPIEQKEQIQDEPIEEDKEQREQIRDKPIEEDKEQREQIRDKLIEEDKEQDNKDEEMNGEKQCKEKKLPMTENEKKKQRAIEMKKHLEALEIIFNDAYSFSDGDSAEITMKMMYKVIDIMIDELYQIGNEYEKKMIFQKAIEVINERTSTYSEPTEKNTE